MTFLLLYDLSAQTPLSRVFFLLPEPSLSPTFKTRQSDTLTPRHPVPSVPHDQTKRLRRSTHLSAVSIPNRIINSSILTLSA